ncbi:MAG: hypothetical protein K2X34_01880 [Hyphomonadaceae bacterium]|nr:hypothetical protein [Hyphomonadaceae bacterium]MBY0565111.1 hypothetical protein [Hyphomonadaceae bacterium]
MSIAAFLTYAEADERTVQKLRQRLASYRVPAITRREAKLGRFFGHEVAPESALSSANFLVVCATPSTPTSARVDAAIESFIIGNRGARLLLVLLDGAPNTALPLRVRGRDPLVADFTAKGDGEELGFLKLVAELVEVNVGLLCDAQARKQKSRGAWLGASVAILATALGASTVAGGAFFRARVDALALTQNALDLGVDLANQTNDDDVKAQAEERLTRLVTDTHPSHTRTRQHARILTRFAAAHAQAGDAEGARGRALAAVQLYASLPARTQATSDHVQALMLLSEAASEADAALAYARQAAAVARLTSSAGARAHLAQALAREGALLLEAQNPGASRMPLTEAVSLYEAIYAETPDDEQVAVALSQALQHLGRAHAALGDQTQAQGALERWVAFARARNAAAKPGARLMLAEALNRLGQTLLQANDPAAAGRALNESLSLYRAERASSPGTPALNSALAQTLILSAQVESGLGRASPRLLDEAIAVGRTRVSTDPVTPPILGDLLSARAAQLQAESDWRAAEAHWREAVQVRRRIRARSGQVREPLEDLSRALAGWAAAARQLGDRDALLGVLSEAASVQRALVRIAPDDRGARAGLGEALQKLGAAQLQGGDTDPARASFAEAARVRVALAEVDLSDRTAARHALESLEALLQIQGETEDAAGVQRTLMMTQTLLSRLVEADPGQTRYQAALSGVQGRLGALEDTR